MTTHGYESYAASIKAAGERGEKDFKRARKREERLIVAVFVAVCGCAEVLLLLALAHR